MTASALLAASLPGLVPLPPPVGDATVAGLRAQIGGTEAVIAVADRTEQVFFAGYHRFVAPLMGGDAVAATCGDPARARDLAEARRALAGYRGDVARVAAAVAALAWYGPDEALTPWTRARLARLRTAPDRAREALRVMEVLFARQMDGELASVGCGAESAASAGAGAAAAVVAPDAIEFEEAREGEVPEDDGALRVRIRVDNAACAVPLDVVVDGQAIGHAGGGATTVIEAPAGWRHVCLSRRGRDRCDDPARQAVVYLHEGWMMRPHCVARE